MYFNRDIYMCYIVGSDYNVDRTTLTFSNSSSSTGQQCITVNVTGDSLTEDDENFLIILSPVPPDIFSLSNSLQFTIVDDGDSKH